MYKDNQLPFKFEVETFKRYFKECVKSENNEGGVRYLFDKNNTLLFYICPVRESLVLPFGFSVKLDCETLGYFYLEPITKEYSYKRYFHKRKELSRTSCAMLFAYELGYRFNHTNSCIENENFSKEVNKINKSQKYPEFSFTHDGERYSFKVHRLIAYQKFGYDMFEDGVLIRHLDDDPMNMSCENIELGDARDNYFDIPREMRDIMNSSILGVVEKQRRKNTVRFLTTEQAKEILHKHRLWCLGKRKKNTGFLDMISKDYSISRSVVSKIIAGKAYNDVYVEFYEEISNV